MISRRDSILKRPWEIRRYQYHLKKIQSASAIIDNKSPVSRRHVSIKLKKKQKEDEKCCRIERENFLLLQRLNNIMKNNEPDKFWSSVPKVSGRVQLFSASKRASSSSKPTSADKPNTTGRRSVCYACNPNLQQAREESKERIPWDPQHKPISTRFRSKSVPAKKVAKLPTVNEQSEVDFSNEKRTLSGSRKHLPQEPLQSIILNRGSLVLSVNFPSDTFVKYQSGKSGKILQNKCFCKNWIKT